MTLVPTLYDFQVALSHVDRSIDQPTLVIKLARHPSETMQRAWLRVLAFCWLWEERLTFGKGLAEPEAPDIECRDYTGLVTRWVRVGKGDPVKVQRAVDQNPHAKVAVIFESTQRLEAFLAEAREAKASRVSKAELIAVDADLLRSLSQFDSRRIKLSLTFVGDHVYAECDGQSFDGPITRATL
ncbi:YaeQ family protein [Pyxidicoccus xibeiensis]|uniref:YaeQ family protein n=1 Tax=Pyxidicoccus xibeiensis TaxID=2906759 RepID=UPI0020A757C9|nr:YaeQ family protein [Pyxidicoccus xibeiensis]MCP3137081.1 YaeQ family protein [Pyxidicoccus xibeiensis]